MPTEAQREYHRKWRARNRERVRASKKRWVAKNWPRIRKSYAAQRRKWGAANKEQLRLKMLKRRLHTLYGISYDEYLTMLTKQNNCCGLCERPESSFARGLCVDHDHATGRVRQLLCVNCNTALGKFQDNPDLLRKAANYIERFMTDDE